MTRADSPYTHGPGLLLYTQSGWPAAPRKR
jgi:hypothetical protein